MAHGLGVTIHSRRVRHPPAEALRISIRLIAANFTSTVACALHDAGMYRSPIHLVEGLRRRVQSRAVYKSLYCAKTASFLSRHQQAAKERWLLPEH
eukprot:COSAG02_NODE_2051_length_10000_cov_2.340471_11_plen_96_part_00